MITLGNEVACFKGGRYAHTTTPQAAQAASAAVTPKKVLVESELVYDSLKPPGGVIAHLTHGCGELSQLHHSHL